MVASPDSMAASMIWRALAQACTERQLAGPCTYPIGASRNTRLEQTLMKQAHHAVSLDVAGAWHNGARSRGLENSEQDRPGPPKILRAARKAGVNTASDKGKDSPSARPNMDIVMFRGNH